MGKKIINFLGFQVGWFATVWGAAEGLKWLGPVVVFLLLVIHLCMSSDRRREVLLLITVGVIGFVIDSILLSLRVFTFPSDVGGWTLCPLWLVGLWILLASTVNVSLSWMKGRPWVAAMFGVIGGPMAYWGGSRMGAIQMGDSLATSLIVFAIVWGSLMPLFLQLAASYSRSRAPLVPSHDAETS